jgi:hypothetical protein
MHGAIADDGALGCRPKHLFNGAATEADGAAVPPVPDKSANCAADSRMHWLGGRYGRQRFHFSGAGITARRSANFCGLLEVIRCFEQRALDERQAKKFESEPEAVA